jgi:hypothetical protein
MNFVLKLSHNISFLEGYIFLENMWTSQFGYSTNLTQLSHYYNIHIITKECSTTKLEIYHDTKKILILRLIHTHAHTYLKGFHYKESHVCKNQLDLQQNEVIYLFVIQFGCQYYPLGPLALF